MSRDCEWCGGFVELGWLVCEGCRRDAPLRAVHERLDEIDEKLAAVSTSPPSAEVESLRRALVQRDVDCAGLRAALEALRPLVEENEKLRARLARIEPVFEAAKAFHQQAARSATDPRYPNLLAGTNDWACEKCRPFSDMLKPGFRCAPHALKDAIDAALAEKEQG